MGTSVREIVQEAQATNSMLYDYFEHKEGVFRRLIDLLFEDMNVYGEEIFQRDLPIRERVSMFYSLHLNALRDAPDALRFVFSMSFGPPASRPDIDILNRRKPLFSLMEQMFSEAIAREEFEPRAGLSPGQLALLMLGVINNHLMYVLKMIEFDHKQILSDGKTGMLYGVQTLEQLVRFSLMVQGNLNKES